MHRKMLSASLLNQVSTPPIVGSTKLFNECVIYRFVHNMSHSLKNPEIRSMPFRKMNFLKRTPINHFHSCFLVVFYHVRTI